MLPPKPLGLEDPELQEERERRKELERFASKFLIGVLGLFLLSQLFL